MLVTGEHFTIVTSTCLQGGSRPHVIFAKNEVRITVFDDGHQDKELPTGFAADVEGDHDPLFFLYLGQLPELLAYLTEYKFVPVYFLRSHGLVVRMELEDIAYVFSLMVIRGHVKN